MSPSKSGFVNRRSGVQSSQPAPSKAYIIRLSCSFAGRQGRHKRRTAAVSPVPKTGSSVPAAFAYARQVAGADQQVATAFCNVVGIRHVEDHLELPNGTLADIRHDNDYLKILKMHATVEPLLNQLLEQSITRVMKHPKVFFSAARPLPI